MLTVLITISTTIKKMIMYFRDKNYKSKKRYKKYETHTSLLESVDTVVVISSTATAVTLAITGFGLVIVPVSAGIACSLSLCNKISQ